MTAQRRKTTDLSSIALIVIHIEVGGGKGALLCPNRSYAPVRKDPAHFFMLHLPLFTLVNADIVMQRQIIQNDHCKHELVSARTLLSFVKNLISERTQLIKINNL